MIGIYKQVAGAEDERIPHGYNGLTINDDAYPVGIAVMLPRWDAVTEPFAQADGMEGYAPRRLNTVLQVEGVVKSDSLGQLHDRIDALNAAFDPVRVTDTDTQTYDKGFLPYTFSVPTADTANYPTGLKPMQMYVRSLALPVSRVSKFEGDGAKYSLVLQAVDPRRYLQTESTHTMASLTTILNNSLASYKSFPILTLTMSGAGGNWWINNHNDVANDPLTLALGSLGPNDILIVDMKRRAITINGAGNMGAYLEGEYLSVMPRSQTMEISDLNGIASAVLTYRRAFG